GHPSRGEVMLHHADPAVIGLLRVAGLAFIYVRERDFLELVLFGVESRTREGAVEGRRVTRVVAIARQLQIQRRCDGRRPHVLYGVSYVDVVAAAVQGI